jgi:hypothetical protein
MEQMDLIMPPLKNLKHEMFAKFVIDGLPQADAFQKAGFSRHDSSASRLLHTAKIQARIRELRDIEAAAAAISKSWVLSGLVQLYQDHKIENPSAAAKALELIGKTDNLKMFTDKKEVRQINSIADLTGEEKTKLLADLKARIEPGDIFSVHLMDASTGDNDHVN